MLIMPEELANKLKVESVVKDRDDKKLAIVVEELPNGEERKILQPAEGTSIAKSFAPNPEIKNVKGYGDRFMVTDDGNVLSKASNKVLAQHQNEYGYNVIATKIGGREGSNVLMRVHRLVAEAFIDNPDNKPIPNHKDGVKDNNCKGNLEWSTYQENSQHAVSSGLMTQPKGTNSPNAKLSKHDVEVIRQAHGKMSGREAEKVFNISRSTIHDIWNGVRYNE